MSELKKCRDLSAECPDCQEQYLYTDYYDKCYRCGRNVIAMGVACQMESEKTDG
jgi:uncharacterized protein (DUF983 family)